MFTIQTKKIEKYKVTGNCVGIHTQNTRDISNHKNQVQSKQNTLYFEISNHQK
jgi:hypothetical protein